jgi:Holliday junction resolvase RusA-like endonuclease
MELPISFSIPGDPVGKARARVFRNKHTGRVHAVTPEKTMTYESRVRSAAIEAMRGSPPLDGPVSLQVFASWTLPRSKWKKKSPVGPSLRTGKPDWDNVGKIVSDALNGIAYLDDSQVVTATVSKKNGAQGEAGYLRVVISPARFLVPARRRVVS